MLPIDKLITPITEDEAFEAMLDILEALEIPARSWRKRAALRVIVRVCARLYSGFTVVMAAFIRSGFLETSQGEWLTALAKYVYGVERRRATFARGVVRLTNDGSGYYEELARSFTVLSPSTKKAYVNVEDFTLGPGETKDIVFEAVEQGSASSAAPDTITDFETSVVGVTATNPKPIIGLDEEQDPDLRQACRDKLGAQSVRGPRGAYAWAIREATREDGSPININRVRVSSSDSQGRVWTWLAAPDGAPAEEDLEAARDSVELRARPDGVRAYVEGANEVVIARTLTIWARRVDGVDADTIRALVETAFVREGPAYRVGGLPKPPSKQGYVWADWITGTAKGAHASIYAIDGEGDDVALSDGDVAVFQITAPVVRLVEAA